MVIILTEGQYDSIKKDSTMSEYRFESNMKHFVAELLKDPAHARPSEFLEENGFDRITILRKLADEGILKRRERVSDRDKDGNYKKATMMVSYTVDKGKLDKAISKIYDEKFGDTKEINEEGAGGGGAAGGACAGGSCSGSEGGGFLGGATSCDGGMAYDAPAFQPSLLKRGKLKVNWLDGKKKKKKKLQETVDDREKHYHEKESQEKEYDNFLNLPPVETLGDGEYDGALYGHSFAYNGNKYYSETGIMNMFPQMATFVVKDGECKVKNIDNRQHPELKSLFK